MKKLCRYFLLEKKDYDLVGEVYLALKREEDGSVKPYSVTRVREELRDDPLWKELVSLQEFAKGLDHPNLLKFEDWGKCKDGVFLATLCHDYIPLSAVFEKLKKKKLPFTLDIPLHTVSQILAGLSYLHSLTYKNNQLLHGCLSPSEIFLNPDGVPLIKHFGVFQILRNRRELQKSIALEKTNFVAPEVSKRLKLSPQADVYSAAAILYYMLTGKIFPAGENPESILPRMPMQIEYEGRKAIPPNLVKILIRALHPDPEKRYSTVDKFKSALDDFIVEEDITSTTFNVAYYLNTLFQEDIVKTKRKIKEGSEKVPVEIIEEKEEEIITTQIMRPEEERKKSPLPLIAALVVVIAVGIGLAIFLTRKPAPPPAPAPQLSQAELEKRVQEELQKRLAAIEEKLKKELENKYKGETEKLKQELARRLEEARKRELARIRQEQLQAQKQKKVETAPAQGKPAATQQPVPQQKQQATTQQKAQTPAPVVQEKKETKKEEVKPPVTRAIPTVKKVKEGDLVPLAKVDSPPVVIKRVVPRKPRKAIRRRISGVVEAMVLVSEFGTVEEVKIRKASPPGFFEEVAVKALMQWRFKPAIKDGVRVKTWYFVTLKF